jgi:hypothetical protein
MYLLVWLLIMGSMVKYFSSVSRMMSIFFLNWFKTLLQQLSLDSLIQSISRIF